MSRSVRNNRRAWTAHQNGSEGQARTSHLPAAKANHDALEKSCAEYAWVRHRVVLLKADAESVTLQNGVRKFRATSGIPDRIAVIPPTGRFAGFEFKTGSGKLRPNQHRVHQQLLRDGGAVYTIYDFGAFVSLLDLLMVGEMQKHLKLHAA